MTLEAIEWLALHRAHEGGIARLHGEYFNHGRPVISDLIAEFERLIDAGLLALGQPDFRGRQQVCVTHPGQLRYAALRNGRPRQKGTAGP